jgi:hypothetical protein
LHFSLAADLQKLSTPLYLLSREQNAIPDGVAYAVGEQSGNSTTSGFKSDREFYGLYHADISNPLGAVSTSR